MNLLTVFLDTVLETGSGIMTVFTLLSTNGKITVQNSSNANSNILPTAILQYLVRLRTILQDLAKLLLDLARESSDLQECCKISVGFARLLQD